MDRPSAAALGFRSSSRNGDLIIIRPVSSAKPLLRDSRFTQAFHHRHRPTEGHNWVCLYTSSIFLVHTSILFNSQLSIRHTRKCMDRLVLTKIWLCNGF